MSPDQVRLGRLYHQLSELVDKPAENVDVVRAKLIEEHGLEDVLWMTNVVAEDLASA